VPIRVEFETDTHRIRDCFVWNLHETLIKPEAFARTFCTDLDLPAIPWVETVANQIRAQLEEHEGIASLDLGIDAMNGYAAEDTPGEELPECRVIVSVRPSLFFFCFSLYLLPAYLTPAHRLTCRSPRTTSSTTSSGTSSRR
jgi:hypothetical protein